MVSMFLKSTHNTYTSIAGLAVESNNFVGVDLALDVFLAFNVNKAMMLSHLCCQVQINTRFAQQLGTIKTLGTSIVTSWSNGVTNLTRWYFQWLPPVNYFRKVSQQKVVR